MDDRDKKGRNINYVGSKHGMSIFNEEKVIAIRILYQIGISQSEIARMYKTSRELINQIVHRKIWNHI